MNKRGMELLTAIILIVLGVILIFILVYAANNQFNFFQTTSQTYGGINNGEALVQACSVSCREGNGNVQKPVTLKGGINFVATCNEIANGEFDYTKISCANLGGSFSDEGSCTSPLVMVQEASSLKDKDLNISDKPAEDFICCADSKKVDAMIAGLKAMKGKVVCSA